MKQSFVLPNPNPSVHTIRTEVQEKIKDKKVISKKVFNVHTNNTGRETFVPVNTSLDNSRC